jgi:hypothetical protein
MTDDKVVPLFRRNDPVAGLRALADEFEKGTPPRNVLVVMIYDENRVPTIDEYGAEMTARARAGAFAAASKRMLDTES